MIKVKGLSKTFITKDNSIKAVDNVDLNCRKGEVTALLGPNGAGKTTLIKMICGITLADRGDIFINGINIKENPALPASQVGVVLEHARNVYQYLSVKDTLEYFGLLNGLKGQILNERIEYVLDLFQLSEKLNSKVGSLSRGMQQQLAIMIALLKDPPILVLDEPTLGLDVMNSIKTKELIKFLSQEKTILLTTHTMELIEAVSDRVAIIRAGKIIKNESLEDLKQEYDLSKETFKISFHSPGQDPLPELLALGFDEEALTAKSDSVYEVEVNSELVGLILGKYEILTIEKEATSMESIFVDLIEKQGA